jgi:signal transduction histidine kinase
LFYIAPVVQKDDRVTGSVGVMLDLTERNLATTERIEKEKFQGVLETAGAVCHELNQPLQVLSGYVDIVLMQPPGETPPPDLATQIQDQVARMADITQKLQEITHYETMNYGEHLKIIDIHKASRPEQEEKT